MYSDICEILPITKDPDLGTETLGTAFTVKCRAEHEDQTARTSDGNADTYTRLYLLPPDTIISSGDKIKTTHLQCSTFTDKYVIVSKVFPVGLIKPSHLEVYTKDV